MKSADGEARAHYGLAVCCARRFLGRGVPREDLLCEAEAALLWAASRFDASRGVRFSTYAIPVVLGALRECCRRAAPMHMPRDDRRLAAAAGAARNALCLLLEREPTIGELAARVGAPPERLGAVLEARERMLSAADEAELQAVPAPEADFEDMALLRVTIARLNRPYAQVLWLRFGAGLSQAEAAARLRVSQPQLSRWERRGRELLGERLRAEG